MGRVKQYGLNSFLILILSVAITAPVSAASSISSGNKLAVDAKKQIGVTVSYDPTYRKLDFPRGDVAQDTGVCTDVVVRAYRLQNIDLQQLINVDMKANFSAYPNTWGLKSTDKNIDHRRVPNLETYFTRHGQPLSVTDKAGFLAGDIVSWRLPTSNLPHIGIVSDKLAADGTPLIIHNIGRGTQEENILFTYPIKGHFRY
ncbi:DUF1287 domain-containing protein [Psychrobacter sp. TAE2020]|uniref:DUF1287 domain-containing protein n=1 Tax=Psychrobacter sp. TAE2020 TaxID=2846762 RepID=UPI001C121673|nr:DUF1287 domain-containing protein [Psychrobacter sp. TAE2020]MBU5617409.1 DUF1287 domain-containing protein [Psychrobacter sp. TAE2020]